MTGEKANVKELKKIILPLDEFHPFPKYEERDAWDKVPEYFRKAYLDPGKMQKLLDYVPMILEASRYMKLYRTGSIDEQYMHDYWLRRDMLVRAVLTECIEGKGRFIDKIIDLIWCICEESSWIIDRHNNHMHNHMLSGVNKNALPDVLDYNFVDLFSGATGGTLAVVYYLLRDRLNEESPLVAKRIELELQKRVFIPFMHHDDMTWMGFYGHKINNWNPWILSNIIVMTLFAAKDPDFRVECLARCMEKLDIYTNTCKTDGGCDEGPSYWYHAGVTLHDCLDLLSDCTAGKLNFFGENFVKNMGEYVVKAQLGGIYQANFADNSAKAHHDPVILYRFAKNIESRPMERFALSRFDAEKAKLPDWECCLYRDIKSLFCYGEMFAEQKTESEPISAVLPETQLLYAHTTDDKVQLAAKGGFNNESHNHNDLGNFILARNGKPVIADLGCLPYEDKTFSPQRYEIWILTAAWHNCAQINGYEQHDGDEFRAKLLHYALNEDDAEFVVDLTEGYEKEAGIKSYIRRFDFSRSGGKLTVTDELELFAPGVMTRHFVSVVKPVVAGSFAAYDADDAVLELHYGENKKTDLIVHDLEAASLKAVWECDECYKLDVTESEKKNSFCVTAEFIWKTK